MQAKYLGDSYDLVKRFLGESLHPIGPLYAHPKFVPFAIREEYTAVTLIPILNLAELPQEPYGLLLDPNTGILLSTEISRGISATHASLSFIVQTSKMLQPAYIVCFDQSYHRCHELSRVEQREKKMAFLSAQGIGSLYYVSQASFLFAAEKPENLAAILQRLESRGIPKACLQLKGKCQVKD